MTCRYMLDTDTVSFALRGQGRVGERLLSHAPSELCMSALTLAELRYGADLKGSRQLRRLIDTFHQSVSSAPFDANAAARFAAVGAALARAGTPIGLIDTLIAAHALTLGLVLVSNNAHHFRRVAGLQLETWA